MKDITRKTRPGTLVGLTSILALGCNVEWSHGELGASDPFEAMDTSTFEDSGTVEVVTCAACNTLDARAPDAQVLLIYDLLSDGTQALVNTLETWGFTVTLSATAESGWDGTNPGLDAFDAVIHLNGRATFRHDMPAAGQQALVDWVRGGGTYVTSGVNGIEHDTYGHMQSMTDLVLLQGHARDQLSGIQCGTDGIWATPTVEAKSHPLMATRTRGVRETLCAERTFAREFSAAPSQVLMRDALGHHAVVVRELGAGRAVTINQIPNTHLSSANDPLRSEAVRALHADGVLWGIGALAPPPGTGGESSGDIETLRVTTNWSDYPQGTLYDDENRYWEEALHTKVAQLEQFDPSQGNLLAVHIEHSAQARYGWSLTGWPTTDPEGYPLRYDESDFVGTIAHGWMEPRYLFVQPWDTTPGLGDWWELEKIYYPNTGGRTSTSTANELGYCASDDLAPFVGTGTIPITKETSVWVNPYRYQGVRYRGAERGEIAVEYQYEPCETCGCSAYGEDEAPWTSASFAAEKQLEACQTDPNGQRSCQTITKRTVCEIIGGLGVCNMEYCTGEPTSCTNASIHDCKAPFDCDDFAFSLDELLRRQGIDSWQLAIGSFDLTCQPLSFLGPLSPKKWYEGHVVNIVRLPLESYPQLAGADYDVFCVVEPQSKKDELVTCWAQNRGTRPRPPRSIVPALRERFPDATLGRYVRLNVWEDGHSCYADEAPFTQVPEAIARFKKCTGVDPRGFRVDDTEFYSDTYCGD